METKTKTASVILAAGRGSRMKEFEGNKTLLPLLAGRTPYQGRSPILMEILDSLPAGPKAVVINHKKEAVKKAARDLGLTYCEQPVLNGTGGGLLAAQAFLKDQKYNQLIITMGDVPFVKKGTYVELVNSLYDMSLVVLGFRPQSKKQYGVLDIDGPHVRRIIEWKYWKSYPEEKQQTLAICNSGIYAAKKGALLPYLSILASRPHRVKKEIDGKLEEVEEFFLTDIIEYMHKDGLPVGYIIAENEEEVMGIDDLDALLRAQEIFMAGN